MAGTRWWSPAATAPLEANAFTGARRVIDLSGDGRANHSVMPHLPLPRDLARACGITINGLAIPTNHADLAAYYRAQAIVGPGAFVPEAESYRDFATTMTAKPLREISPSLAHRVPAVDRTIARRRHPGLKRP